MYQYTVDRLRGTATDVGGGFIAWGRQGSGFLGHSVSRTSHCAWGCLRRSESRSVLYKDPGVLGHTGKPGQSPVIHKEAASHPSQGFFLFFRHGVARVTKSVPAAWCGRSKNLRMRGHSRLLIPHTETNSDPEQNQKCVPYSPSRRNCMQFHSPERAIYPRLLSYPGAGTHAVRVLLLSRGLDPQGPHPKIREISPIAAGDTESKFGSFGSGQRVIRTSPRRMALTGPLTASTVK